MIKSQAFYKCSSLKEIVYNGTNVPYIEGHAFTIDVEWHLPQNLIVTVPESYQGSNFGPFGSDQIKGKAFNITFSTTGKGTVTAKVGETDNATSAGSLEEVTLNVQPEEGYLLKSLTVNGGSVDVTEDNTFIMPFGDATVTATFQKDPWDEETKTLTVILGETTEYSSYKELAEHLVIKAGTSTEIEEGAFSSWSKLQSVAIEDKVENIGHSAFSGCSSLTNITIPNSVTTIGRHAFLNCTTLKEITIPNSVTSIGLQAFTLCSELTEVTIPGSVESIESQTFANCSALEKVTIEEGVKSIGDYAFNVCTALTEITIPRSVKSIGQQAFQECTALTEVTIPGSVESIGQLAFTYCSALEKVTIEKGVESIGDGAFAYCTLTEVTIPESVKSIGQDAFYNCSALKKVTIEEGVESIGDGAFYACSSLTEVIIPGSVKSFGQQAFDSCTALEKVTIGEGVESIGHYAFDVCPLLTNIIYEGTTEPTTIGYAAFPTGNAGITVTVPEEYQSDGFGDFSIYQIIGKTSGITIIPPTHGSISAQRDGQEVASVKSGDVVKVVATPEEGYKLESLTVKDRNKDEVTLTDDNTFTMPFGGATISATFTEETTPEPEEPEEPVIPDYPDYYNIYVEECEGVTVLTSTNVVREGNSMTFTIEVAEGYTAEDMVVKVKRSLFGYTDVIEPNEEGKYEVRNIYTEIYITIEGVTEEETPTGIEELPQAKVYAKEGSLYVETPQCETVTIVSMTGAIVGQSEQIGLKRYDLPRGIYIIGIGTERYKVRI